MDSRRGKKLKKQYNLIFVILAVVIIITVFISSVAFIYFQTHQIDFETFKDNIKEKIEAKRIEKVVLEDLKDNNEDNILDIEEAIPTPVEPSPTPVPKKEYEYNSIICPSYEEDVDYCRGWTVVDLRMYDDSLMSNHIETLTAGTPIVIMYEENDLFHIFDGTNYGFVNCNYCMINLPDYFGKKLSYDITNSYSSIIRKNGSDISITGKMIPGYENVKLSDNDYLVPMLYPSAKKLSKAIKLAKDDGYRLCVYDAFHPGNSDVAILNALGLNNVIDTEETATNNISDEHFRGVSVDVILTDNNSKSLMPSPVYDIKDATGGFGNDANVKRLISYMTDAGFTNINDNYWHYQDNESINLYGLRSYPNEGIIYNKEISDTLGIEYKE